MTDASLIPRTELLGRLMEALRAGSVLLHGPRRVGKSTLLEQLSMGSTHGLSCLRIDLEGFLQQPISSLTEQVRLQLRQGGLLRDTDLAQRVQAFEIAGLGATLAPLAARSPWEQLQGDLIDAMQALPAGLLVVALDEVPWWLGAIEDEAGAGAARGALASLRRIRQHRLLAERVRFILTGSIGLAGLAAELGASAELNDLLTVEVPPMDVDQASTLFETELSASGRTCSPEAARHAATLSGGSPHWVKRLASLIGAAGARDAAVVEAAVEALLAPSLRKELADEGREHFRRRHPTRMAAMLALLDSVSGGDLGQPVQGARNAALQAQPELNPREVDEVLYLLIDGYYLRMAADGTLEWVNPLLRRWWLKYGGS